MKAFKRIFVRFLSVLFILSALPLAALSAGAAPPTDGVRAALLYNIEGDRIILSKNEKEKLAPSALAKIASGLILCEELSGQLDESITLTPEMLEHADGRKFGLYSGYTLTVRDLLRIAVCGSYNDAFCALAVFAAEGYGAFVDQMNVRAQELGADSTVFSNPVGLDGEKMQTTAADMLKFCRAAAENELYMSLSSTYSYTVTVNGSVKNIVNRNGLHDIYGNNYNENALGFASGMTDRGGYCLATLGGFDGAKYICIVMGASEENREYELATALLAYASDNYSVLTLKNTGDAVGSIPVSLTDLPTELPLVLGEDIRILLGPDHTEDELRTVELILSRESLEAPVEKGAVVGYMIVHSRGELLACVPVITARGVEKNEFLGLIEDMKTFIGGRVVISALVFALIFTVAFIIGYYVFSKKKRRRPVYARGKYR